VPVKAGFDEDDGAVAVEAAPGAFCTVAGVSIRFMGADDSIAVGLLSAV
jgi:hypothetical protein